MSIESKESDSAAIAVAPRVTLDYMNSRIAKENYINAAEAAIALGQTASKSMALLTLCIITMKNGFTVVGKSACASKENFNPELGKKFSREDAMNQLWALEGFALRERLSSN